MGSALHAGAVIFVRNLQALADFDIEVAGLSKVLSERDYASLEYSGRPLVVLPIAEPIAGPDH